MTSFTLPRIEQVDSDEDDHGVGTLKTDVGNLPLKQLAYRSRVVGLAVQTTIKQTFYNPFDECIEATYVFPIEGEQAVVGCEIWVADRLVCAELKERAQARSEYQHAIKQGYRAALLEQNRGETFSMKVGNIPPGEAIQVRIETIGNLAVAHGEWTLRMPLVVAPRYTSGFALPGTSVGCGTSADTDQVPDASMVTPATWLPGFPSPVDLSIEVEIEPGAQMRDLDGRSDWPSRLRSSLHAVSVETLGDDEESDRSCRIRIRPGEKVDRDFILRGTFDASKLIGTLMVDCESGVFALQMIPPVEKSTLPKDVVFLLDRSGSMSGWKMNAARRGISRLVDTLGAKDRFHVIAFDHRIESCSRQPHVDQWETATDANRYHAIRWLAGIESHGGTELGMAIDQGLQPFLSGGDELRSSAIVLVTDGQVTGEDSLLRVLNQLPPQHRPRMFCLGIDRAVNAGVLQRLAKFTNGICEVAESESRLDEIMQRFGDEIGSPSIIDLHIEAGTDAGAIDRLAPSKHAMLYPGRPVSIYGRASDSSALQITVKGRLASGKPWCQTIAAETVAFPDGSVNLLHSMWGRAMLREMEDAYAAESAPNRSMQNDIIQCSIETRVLSRFTAFVAVDRSERVNRHGNPHAIEQPAEYPEGWQALTPSPIHQDQLLAIPRPEPSQPMKPHPAIRSSKASDGVVLPTRFDELIVQKGIVSLDQFSEAEALAKSTSMNTGDALVRLEYASAEEIARTTAEAFQIPYVDLRTTQIPMTVIELIPESVARENGVLPISESGSTLTILVSNPSDLETIEKLRFILNRNIQTMLATPNAILHAINHYYGQVEGESADSMLQEFTDTAIDFTETDDDTELDWPSEPSVGFTPSENEIEFADEDICMIKSLPVSVYMPPSPRRPSKAKRTLTPGDAPVIRLVNLIMMEAVQLGATHVVLVPNADAIFVKYVLDGVMVDREQVPSRMLTAIVTRLKVLAGVDVASPDSFETGTMQLTIGDTPATCQVHFGLVEDGPTILIEVSVFGLGKLPPADGDGAAEQPDCVREWWAAWHDARSMQVAR